MSHFVLQLEPHPYDAAELAMRERNRNSMFTLVNTCNLVFQQWPRLTPSCEPHILTKLNAALRTAFNVDFRWVSFEPDYNRGDAKVEVVLNSMEKPQRCYYRWSQ